MSFLKNKHVVTSLIVAPVLAISSFFLVDLWFKEPAIKPEAGQAYRLVASSNCRFSSGVCDLENGNFKSTLTVSKIEDENMLHLKSLSFLQAVSVGFVDENGLEIGPLNLVRDDKNKYHWAIAFDVAASAQTNLRLAITANDAHYFTETTMAFSEYQTSFNNDFRK